MAYAAKVMRGLIIDHVRSRQTKKRGGDFALESLTPEVEAPERDAAELDRIAEALEVLASQEPQLAQLVDLKFFCGFSFAEIAVMRGVSERTVQRDWKKARLFIHHQVGDVGLP
jgi:RNA polymerase sigma factor (TIGR02999 family)